MRPYGTSSYFTGLGLAGLDLALFVSLSTLVVALPNVPGKLLSSIALALIMSRLFVLGHDAGHHSLTPSRRINTILARILFLPTYSCFSLWQAGHNVAHHGFAGLKGRDVPWVPLSPDEYISRPRTSRWLYRVYRSWWGAGVYYGLDVWWRQLIFPRGKIRKIFLWDSLVVTAFFALQLTGYVIAARATGQSAITLVALGVVVPFILWLYMAGIVFFLDHTDHDARWYVREPEWRQKQPDLGAAHCTSLPLGLHRLLHHALDHAVHHIDPTVPSYRMMRATSALAARYPLEISHRHIGLARYMKIAKACQLYDYVRHEWVSIGGLESERARGDHADMPTESSAARHA